MVDVDLHLHTTFSDGTLSPSEVVALCASRGLKTIAVTDHDSTEGVAEAQEAAEGVDGLEVIPGVELSTDIPGSEVHLLGYFVDCLDERLQGTLRDLRDGREDRARKIVEKLDELGVKVSWRRVQELSGGGAIGRPHIAQALVEQGYVRYPRDAFDKYLGRNGPAYAERVKLTPVEAVEMLARHGAVPVLAHPTFIAAPPGQERERFLRRTLLQLQEAGLVGMEVYYGGYSEEEVKSLAGIADDLGLVPCGGSDYHAAGNPDEPEPGSVGPPMSSLDALRPARRRLTTEHEKSTETA